MSTAIKYDGELFAIERLDAGTWVTVPAASITYSSDYTLADHHDEVPPSPIQTLVVGSETASISLSRWDEPGDDILYPADRVRASYDGKTFFYGTVESVSITTATDPAAAARGAQRRVDIQCAVGGYYAAMLSRTVTWSGLPPGELWIDRIRRFCVVTSW